MENLLSEIATRLRAQVPEVLARWEDRVLCEVAAASTVNTEELRDHLHILLEQVVIALSPDAPEGARHRLTTAERHGGERALLESYSLGEVLQEVHNTLLKEVLRAFLREDSFSLGRVLSRLNDVICDTLHQDGSDVEGRFIALSLAVINPISGEAAFASAGAEPPLLLRADGASAAVDVWGMSLGIEPGQPYEDTRLRLQPGDTLLMVTDGITEARCGGRLLGYDGMSRLAEESLRSPSIDDAGRAIVAGARAAGGGALQDDACLILARKR